MLASGAAVGVSAFGDPLSTRLVLFFHPTPGAGAFDPNPTLTSTWGAQFVAIDRPGYGGSDPISRDGAASIQSFADDAAEFIKRSEQIARETSNADYGQVGVVGWGTGGAVALSLAARHSDLIDRVAIVSLSKPRALDDKLRLHSTWRERPSVFSASAADFDELLERPDVPVAAATLFADSLSRHYPGLRNRLEHMVGDAFIGGTAGVASDLAAVRDSSWTSELGNISAATVLIYGQHDDVGAKGNGDWYRRRINGARVATVEDTEKLAIVGAWSRILRHVAPDDNKALGARLSSG